MTDYNFDFKVASKSLPAVGITNYGFTFNKAAVEALGSPQYVSFGLDRQAKVLGVKPVTKDGNENWYRFSSERSWALVSASRLRKDVCALLGTISLYNAKYFAEWDDTHKMLLVKLDSPLL